MGMASLNTHATVTACFALHLRTQNVTSLFSKQRLWPCHGHSRTASGPKGGPRGQFKMEKSRIVALESSDAYLGMISMDQDSCVFP